MATNGKMFKVVMFLVGVLISALIGATSFIGKNVIANDKDARERDDAIVAELHNHVINAEDKFHEYCMKQEVQHGLVKEQLATILTELKYLRNGS